METTPVASRQELLNNAAESRVPSRKRRSHNDTVVLLHCVVFLLHQQRNTGVSEKQLYALLVQFSAEAVASPTDNENVLRDGIVY